MTLALQGGQFVACLCAPCRHFPDCSCLATRRRKVLLMVLLVVLIISFGLLRPVPTDGDLDDRKIIHLNVLETERSESVLANQQFSSLDHVIHKLRRHKHRANENPEPITMAAVNNKTFDVIKVDKLFSSCLGEADIISILCYIDAFQELCKLFRLFGTIFGFVTSDVEEKTEILRVYHREQPQQYNTVQSMLEYEVSNGLTDNKKKLSGSRTLLRLHRAMEFISAFLLKLRDSDNNMRFSSSVGEAYDTTLAKHHPWIIRKAVQMALYMLPSRQDLLKKMGIEDNENNMQKIGELISKLNIIFDVIEKLYAKDDLLQLP